MQADRSSNSMASGGSVPGRPSASIGHNLLGRQSTRTSATRVSTGQLMTSSEYEYWRHHRQAGQPGGLAPTSHLVNQRRRHSAIEFHSGLGSASAVASSSLRMAESSSGFSNLSSDHLDICDLTESLKLAGRPEQYQPRQSATLSMSSQLEQQQQRRQLRHEHFDQAEELASCSPCASVGVQDDTDLVFNRLMSLEAFRKLHPSVIRHLCSYAAIERIDKGVIVFRQGEDAINWYALLEGSVDVKVSQSGYGPKDGVTLCTLGVGTTFGASVAPGKSHSITVVTGEQCTLLRVRRADFEQLCAEQSHLIDNVEASPFNSFTASLSRLLPASMVGAPHAGVPMASTPKSLPSSNSTSSAGSSGCAMPVESSSAASRTGPQGFEGARRKHSISNDASAASSVNQLEPLEASGPTNRTSGSSNAPVGGQCSPQHLQQLQHMQQMQFKHQQQQQMVQQLHHHQRPIDHHAHHRQELSRLATDASFRMILSRPKNERSAEEVDMVFEELQHLKALSHLTNGVKRQLAACVIGEHHSKQNTVIFNQGDQGHSWYIILRGSVNVIIVGKGVVCTMHEGDDFGKLALINDAPRAAAIVTNEPGCYFLRVDKHDFNTILRHVEANTVRLKEHGKEVLVLQKVPATASAATAEPSGGSSPADEPAVKYMVMAGTGEKMLEHLLETRIDGSVQVGPILADQSPAGSANGAASMSMSSSYSSSSSSTKNSLMMMTSSSNLNSNSANSAYHELASSASGFGAGSGQPGQGDNFLEDFILTHRIFMPTNHLCKELVKQYQCQGKSPSLASNSSASSLASSSSSSANSSSNANQAKLQSSLNANNNTNHIDEQYVVAKKRRVVKFVRCWMLIAREHFFQQQQHILPFLSLIHKRIQQDVIKFASLTPELRAVTRLLEMLHLDEGLARKPRGIQRWVEDTHGNILPIRLHSGYWDCPASNGPQADRYLVALQLRRHEIKLASFQSHDELVFRVYCTDHSFATLKTRIDERVGQIKLLAATKLKLLEEARTLGEFILVHVKSNGERIVLNDSDSNITTALTINGRLFVCPLDHIDAISPLPEQDPLQEVYAHQQQNPNQHIYHQNDSHFSRQSSLNKLPGGSGADTPNTTSSGNTSSQSFEPTVNSHLLVATPTSLCDIKTQMGLSAANLEEFSSRDVAYCLTQLAWSLLKNMHEYELIYTVFGATCQDTASAAATGSATTTTANNKTPNKSTTSSTSDQPKRPITANLNVFLRHFNEIQYWVVTQICSAQSLSKRVQILRKFIKIAAHCKELQNLNALFAIIMGLSNMAVARLTQTWERLPNKLKRTFSQFESLIDPSRNHRRYRIFISKMEPPIIPFMPLFLKDMTFAHEGNKTYLDNGLINFEKMQMVAQTLRTIRYCKSRSMKLDPSVCKFKGSIRSIELFFRDLKVIDNQRTLTQMSHQLEHRKP